MRAQMIPPISLVVSQGWGLIDLPLRASNEGSPRPRVARAQETDQAALPLPSGISPFLSGIFPQSLPIS